jgi:hypothetical protein
MVQSQPDLFEVIGAFNAVGGGPDLLNRGHQQADQGRDDGNDDQQLDQGEAASGRGPGAVGRHGTALPYDKAVRSRMRNAIGPGAQTSRLDDARPVRSLLGGMASPATCSLAPIHERGERGGNLAERMAAAPP